jgi:uncharacterized protein YwgA
MSYIRIEQIGKDAFKLPDGSIAYSMQRAIKEYKKMKPVKYTVPDLIMFLLYSQDKTIRRRIVLFKELFVLEKAVFKNEKIENCRFVPYHYGPYSFYVANKLENMLSSGLIKRKLFAGTNIEEFTLEPKGEKLIKKKYENLSPKIRNDMEKLRKGLDQYSKHIQEYVYRIPEYKKYTDKSLVRHKYKLITWGRSKK